MDAVDANTLKSEKAYVGLAQKVGGILYKGPNPYNIPAFFKELLKDLPTQCDSGEIKDILDWTTAIYNEKVKKEKAAKTGGKKTKEKQKPGIAGGKNENSMRNQQLVNDNLGMEEDDYGYGDEDYYGEEVYSGGKRVPIPDVDFM